MFNLDFILFKEGIHPIWGIFWNASRGPSELDTCFWLALSALTCRLLLCLSDRGIWGKRIARYHYQRVLRVDIFSIHHLVLLPALKLILHALVLLVYPGTWAPFPFGGPHYNGRALWRHNWTWIIRGLFVIVIIRPWRWGLRPFIHLLLLLRLCLTFWYQWLLVQIWIVAVRSPRVIRIIRST